MSKTFGPTVRLHTRAEFTAVQQGGRRVASRHFTLLGRPNTLGRDRLGIVASRRVGGAVVRNRAKRRFREIFRLEPSATGTALRSMDLVVIARSEVADAPFGRLQQEFHAALEKLRNSR
jgi:ribonuclease P protein component